MFTGPHGAGKDFVEKNIRLQRDDMRRITRHITRQPATGEIDGEDYHFVTREKFKSLIRYNQLIEWAEYPDVLSGTTTSEVLGTVEDKHFASLTINLEDALTLEPSISNLGLQSRAFFISPVTYSTFVESPEQYLSSLKLRMESRGRHHEYVANKLAKAALYRETFLQSPNMQYISNVDGQLENAVTQINLFLNKLDQA